MVEGALTIWTTNQKESQVLVFIVAPIVISYSVEEEVLVFCFIMDFRGVLWKKYLVN